MGRSFTGTDRVAVGSFAPPTTLSILCRSKAPDTATLARYFQNDSDTWIAQNASTDLKFHRDWTTTPGQWVIAAAAHGMTLTNWNHIALTYDGSSTANDPLFYANGVSKTVTRTTAPAGTLWTTAGPWFLGNNSASGTLPHGGSLEWFSIHNVVLTAQEVADHMNYGFVPRGCIGSWSLDGASPEPDLSGSGHDGTVTGTTVVAGSGLLYPTPGLWLARRARPASVAAMQATGF